MLTTRFPKLLIPWLMTVSFFLKKSINCQFNIKQGWFAVRRELRVPMFIFLLLSVLYLIGWGVMFISTTFRWTFTTWFFFSIMACASVFLTFMSIVLGVVCRMNFGKGLARYCQCFRFWLLFVVANTIHSSERSSTSGRGWWPKHIIRRFRFWESCFPVIGETTSHICFVIRWLRIWTRPFPPLRLDARPTILQQECGALRDEYPRGINTCTCTSAQSEWHPCPSNQQLWQQQKRQQPPVPGK